MKAGFSRSELFAHLIRSTIITMPAIATGHSLRMLLNRQFSQVLAPREQTRSVLIIALDHLGDLIISAGYFRDVRRAFPTAKLTLVVDKRFESYAKQCPHVDDVLGFDESGTKFKRVMLSPFQALIFAQRHLWRQRFDVVLNHRWDVDSVHGYLIGLFSLSKVHAGYSNESNPRKLVVNRGINKAFSHRLGSTEMVHESERGTELLRYLDIPFGKPAAELWALPEDLAFAQTEIPRGKYKPLIALGVGASQRRRQWPMRYYSALASSLLEQWPSAYFMIVGNKADRLEGEELRDCLGRRLLNFAAECTVSQSGALLALCDLYVGSDSGPMHMAAAGGVPIVELSCHPLTGAPESAHSPVRYHPLGVPYIVVRPDEFTDPCRYECLSGVTHCMLNVSVDRAVDAAKELLAAALNETVSADSGSIGAQGQIVD